MIAILALILLTASMMTPAHREAARIKYAPINRKACAVAVLALASLFIH